MHSLPREDEEVINDMLKEHKSEIDLVMGELRGGKLVKGKKLKLDFNDKDCIIIPLEKNSKKEANKYEKERDN